MQDVNELISSKGDIRKDVPFVVLMYPYRPDANTCITLIFDPYM